MKKLLIIFLMIMSTPVMASYTNDIIGGCVAERTFSPVFQVNVYNCNAGYFLPADTLGCEPCPNGHTCNGGIFAYNATVSQGISFTRPINANVAKSCSINFGTVLRPIFQKNQMTLNFDDGNGNTTTTTCEYGDTIVIPENIPTRTGYNFTGWVVRQE